METLADLFVVFARTRPADEAGTGIAVFLVPASSPGLIPTITRSG